MTAHFTDRPDGPSMRILMYLPKGAQGRVPAFLGLNFEGNHSISADPAVHLSDAWMRNDENEGRVNHRATERSRGSAASRWPVEAILSRGNSVDPGALYRSWRGHDPRIEPMLKNRGLND